MTEASLPTVAVLGASGLIGEFITSTLERDGFPVVAIARSFPPSQWAQFAGTVIEHSVVSLSVEAIARLLTDNQADIIVNCIGVLQSTPFTTADVVHREFARRLVEALAITGTSRLLIHISI